MRFGTSIPWLTGAVLALGACAEDPPVKDPSTASSSSADTKTTDAPASGDKAAGDKAMPAAAAPGKLEVSCKGKPDVGKNASTFSLSSLNGGSKMGVEKGKVTIVDFWATWCEPCKKSFPKYQELYVKYKTSGLEIVAVSVDDEKKDIPDFIKSYGAKFPVGWDEGHKIAECYHPPNMPSAYVIDKTGVVKFVHNGYHDGEEKELEKEIKSLL
jgi:thiol-disulfide isomerase/thioredoxin